MNINKKHDEIIQKIEEDIHRKGDRISPYKPKAFQPFPNIDKFWPDPDRSIKIAVDQNGGKSATVITYDKRQEGKRDKNGKDLAKTVIEFKKVEQVLQLNKLLLLITKYRKESEKIRLEDGRRMIEALTPSYIKN